MVKDFPANAGDSGLIPDLGKSHISQGSKGPCAATAEPTPRTRAQTSCFSQQERSHHCEQLGHQS